MQTLSQRDARWAKVHVGPTTATVGDIGCALTGVSMLSDYFGEFKDPGTIARLPGLFDTRGRILWGVLPRYFKRFKPVARHQGRDDRLIQAILSDPKRACLLEVNNHKHWVLPTRGTWATDGYLAADPWTGKPCSVLEDYSNITGCEEFVATY